LSSTKEKALEIMKDSRIGSFGVIGIFCLLLLKFALLLNVETLWKSLILMCIFSRFFQVFCCFFSTYPKNSGTGKAFIGYRKKKGIIFGFLFTMLFFLLLDKIGGIILFFTSIIPPILFFLYIKRRIGGMTGDTIGACSEIAEVSFLLFCCLFNIS
ncbi:MAG: adenosylcobinamide-GDP ribazoletransferase, partial [bacterium]